MATKIKYVGVKEDGETAFSNVSGVPRWLAGDSNIIEDDNVAKRMLAHPDVFELDESKPKKSKAEPKGEAEEATKAE